MKYAVIKTGGKQYRVSEGDVLDIEKLNNKTSKTFNNVLLVKDEDKVKVGTPKVKGAKVKVNIVETDRVEKLNIMRFKAKSRYRRRIGHRQPYTRIEITDIITS